MAARSVLQAFEKFQKERRVFVTTIGELAKTPQNIEFLERAGALGILKSLLLDTVPSIQHAAAVALGRLAHANDQLAEAVVRLDVLPLLLSSMEEQSGHYKKAAASCLRAVARHSPELAQTVVEAGAVKPLVACLEDFDPSVKEAAAWTLGYIASHAPDLAQRIADADAVAPLVLCVQAQEDLLKRIAVSALGDVAKHSPELAQLVVDAGTVPHVAELISSQDAKLRRQVNPDVFATVKNGSCLKVFACLANVAKHSADLSEVVVETQIFPKMLTSLKFPDDFVKKHAATLLREISKQTPELAQLVVSHGSVAALVDHIADSEGLVPSKLPRGERVSAGHFRLPSVMAVGFIAAFSETLASTVIAENAVKPLADTVRNEEEDVLRSAATWSLGQIGKHSSEHAKAVSETGILLDFVELEAKETSSEDLKTRSRQAVKAIVAKLTYLPPLDALVHSKLEDSVMQLVLEQLSKVLAHDPQGRSSFVHSGGLALLQELAEAPDSILTDVIQTINSQYPEEIVMHYSPSYSQKLLEKLDAQISQSVN